MDLVHQRKLEIYELQVGQCVKKILIGNYIPIEFGWRGCVTNPTPAYWTNLELDMAFPLSDNNQNLMVSVAVAGALSLNDNDTAALISCLNPESSANEGLLERNPAICTVVIA